jgi:hypothetical protein
MRAFAIALLALYLSVGIATAQTDDQIITWAVGEVGAEMQVCSVYFTIISGCLAGQDPPVTDTSEKYHHAAENLALLGLANQKTAGISDEAYLTFTKILFQDMKKTMGTCTNIAVLFNKYSDFCWRLNQDADPRLKAWIAFIRAKQRTCGGPGLP